MAEADAQGREGPNVRVTRIGKADPYGWPSWYELEAEGGWLGGLIVQLRVQFQEGRSKVLSLQVDGSGTVEGVHGRALRLVRVDKIIQAGMPLAMPKLTPTDDKGGYRAEFGVAVGSQVATRNGPQRRERTAAQEQQDLQRVADLYRLHTRNWPVGGPIPAIARDMGLSERQVQRLLAKAVPDRQSLRGRRR